MDACDLTKKQFDRVAANAFTDDPRPEPPPVGEEKASNDALSAAPIIADAYGLAELERDEQRRLVSLAHLPLWPDAPDTLSHPGHGWGQKMDRALGGGICPGYFVAIGAAAAGAGKTAWAMQLADGLALRSLEQARHGSEPLTPVLIASEMSAQALTWRTLGRWCGVDARRFRQGKTAIPSPEAWANATRALTGDLGESRRYMRILRPENAGQGKSFLTRIENVLAAWTLQLEAEHAREVWPVVVVDPIQRFADHSKSEVEGDNAIVEGLHAKAQAGGWITIVTSDTNKQSATEGAEDEIDRGAKNPAQEGARAFRGTYRLMHLPDAAIYLRPNYSRRDEVWAYIVKNRWGPTAQNSAGDQPGRVNYTWDRAKMRFEPGQPGPDKGSEASEASGHNKAEGLL
jgi:hypothetical protein